ncbi:hypothetical protein [Mycoplasma sp. 21DD0573]|uniref:hypothetical protein n=1 Tax=unclassified Mycoplasma TaxID=2683645 RepID=UPI002B1D7B5C|nr:hypothetical protein [Mycoplasma sp. 21DD0573]MEA4276479.1 hypothetical protein [Mycoplasma sp. 21DD0573]
MLPIKKAIKKMTYMQMHTFIFAIFFLLISVVFLSLIGINRGLFFGYALGGLLIYFLFKLNWLFAYLFLRNKKTKLYALSILKSVLFFLFLGAIVYLMFFINTEYLKQMQITEYSVLQVLDQPFNFFAFAGGILTNIFVIIITEIVNKKIRN